MLFFYFLHFLNRAVFVLPLQNLTHLLVSLQLVFVTVIAQGTTPTIQVVVYQIVVRLQLLPSLLPQVQLLPVVAIPTDREDLVLKFYCLVP